MSNFVCFSVRLIEFIHEGIVKDNSVMDASGSNAGISFMLVVVVPGGAYAGSEPVADDGGLP